MNMIRTVTGDFAVDKLERVLMHEHIVIGYAGWFYDPRCAEFDYETAALQTLLRLKKIRDRGVNLVVDPCPIELGRNPEFMQKMSVQSGVQIVCSTGFDLQARGYMSAFRGATADDIYDIYMYEIENGIGDAKIKPGVIKVATGFGGITEYENRCIEAAGRASVETGLPIITHTEKGTMGPEQVKALKMFGARPEKCLIGHCCANSDLTYHKAIFDEGAYVGFDRFGNSWHGDDYFRVATLAALIHMGYSERLFISCDSVAYLLKKIPGDRDMKNWDPVYLLDTILPWLRQCGVSENDIDNMLCNNAKRFFGG